MNINSMPGPQVPQQQQQQQQQQFIQFKLVMLGEAGVGKSSLALRFVKDKFILVGEESTIGAAYLTSTAKLDEEGNQQVIIMTHKNLPI